MQPPLRPRILLTVAVKLTLNTTTGHAFCPLQRDRPVPARGATPQRVAGGATQTICAGSTLLNDLGVGGFMPESLNITSAAKCYGAAASATPTAATIPATW